MFSQELENLIEATLADGILEENEKAALVKRAQKEGVDLDELEIYIKSIMQKREQNRQITLDKETRAHEKLREGNVCPHCHTVIPPLTKICPNCHQAVNSNETSGDKEMYTLIDQISAATVKVKSSASTEAFKTAKAECEVLLKKANMFYGDNQKVQMLVFDLQNEISTAETKLRSEQRSKTIGNILKNKWLWIVTVTAILLLCTLVSNSISNNYYSDIYKITQEQSSLAASYGLVSLYNSEDLPEKNVKQEDLNKYDELSREKEEYRNSRDSWTMYSAIFSFLLAVDIIGVIVYSILLAKKHFG